jgi:hypothetical protein
MENRNMKTLLLFFLLLAGCNRGPTAQEDPSQPFCPKGITEDAGVSPSVPPPWKHLVLATSDYQTGSVSRIHLEDARVERDFLPVHSDAIVRAPVGSPRIYVVNRLGGDNLQVVSRRTSQTLLQCALGRGTNPQDIAVLDDRTAYITRLRSTQLLKLDLTSGRFKTIDLSGFADADGFPEMTRMLVVGSRLLVQLQRLDTRNGFIPSGKSQVAIVDIARDRVQSALDLLYANPTSDFKRGNDGMIYVAGAGKLGVEDGGIEALDPDSLRSAGSVIEEKELHGDLVDFEILSPTLGVAIVSTPKSRLVAFNPTTHRRLPGEPLLSPPDYSLQGLALDRFRGLLYLADRTRGGPAIRLFDSASLQEKPNRFDLGLPPYQMVLTD